MSRRATLATFLLLPAGAALAQGRADGAYPATLLCEAGAGLPGLRASLVVEIVAGKARYSVPTPAGPETGEGTLSAGTLVLTGRTRRWQARYSGQVDGQGGLLTGRQTAPAGARACQLSLGNGRG